MPSRLSSLLVRDGLVGVKRMEKAFQRQVIYGGSLDTILLEMNLVPEERLTQYLALASGLPPAERDEGNAIEPAALTWITAEIAAQFRAVPLSNDGDALRVLVCSPLEIHELEDLADLLDRPLQPLITPEYRWHLVYARAYRVDAPARFTTLARQLEIEATPSPVGRAKTVIVEELDPGQTIPMVMPESTSAPHDVPMPAPSADVTVKIAHADAGERNKHVTLVGVQPNRAATDSNPPPTFSRTGTTEGLGRTRKPGPTTPPGGMPAVTADGSPLAPEAANPSPPDGSSAAQWVPPDASPMSTLPIALPVRAPAPSGSTVEAAPVPFEQAQRRTPPFGTPTPTGRRRSSPSIQMRASEPIATAGRDSPLAVVRARELLATADDRDTVFLTLLRAARAKSRYAGLLTVQGGAAIGRLALAETGIEVLPIQKVLVPLDLASPFRSVVNNQQPHIGPLTSGDPSIDAMVQRMGGTLPPSVLLMPIVLRGRVVAIVIAHRVHSDLKLVDVTELLPLASAAADALGRLIVRHKSAGYRAPTHDSAPIVVEAAQVDTKKVVRDNAAWGAPAHTEQPALPDEIVVAKKPLRKITDVVDDIENANEGQADEAIADAVERAAETLGELAQRFPGKLRVERFAVSGRSLRSAQYGGLLELTVRLGAAAAELLIDRLSSPQRDVRFYATVCAAELRPRNAVFALIERLFDQDFGVREMAIEALAGYPAAELAQALVKARKAVHSDDPEQVAAATSAIVQLGDVGAVEDLINALERSTRSADNIRKALVALTAQDFGTSTRKWRKWYEGAADRHRIEWLIEGLNHKEDAIRERAINDLRRMTGEYFGYHHDLPRKEREVAADRWASWWRETGERRFVARGDERKRPTGMLPSRKE